MNIVPVAVVHLNNKVCEVGGVEADLADVVPLGEQQHRRELVPARRRVRQQHARVARAPEAAGGAAGDQAQVRAGVVLAGVGVAETIYTLIIGSKNGGKPFQPGSVAQELPGGLEDLHVHRVELGAAQADPVRGGEGVRLARVVHVQRSVRIMKPLVVILLL